MNKETITYKAFTSIYETHSVEHGHKVFQELMLFVPESERHEVGDTWHMNHCPYGKADGPDDFCKDCECLELYPWSE